MQGFQIGLPELVSMFKQVADIRTADTLTLDVPECDYQVVQVEATPFQQELVQELADRADAINAGNVDPIVKSPTEKMLDDKPYSFKDGYDFLECYDEVAQDIAFNFYDVTENTSSGYSIVPPKATSYNPDAPVNGFNRLLYVTDPIYRGYVDACLNCPPPVFDPRNAWGTAMRNDANDSSDLSG